MTRTLVCTTAVHDAIRADRAAFSSLAYVGVQPVPGDGDEPAYDLELRNCGRCHSTLAVVIGRFTIVMDDDASAVLYWCGNTNGYDGYDGQGWSASGADAMRFAAREDADIELRAALRGFDAHDRRRQYVTIDETD